MRRLQKRLIGGLALLAPALAHAQTLPTGGAYAAGAGSIVNSGATTTINQSSPRGIINWQGFSIGAGGTVNINNGAGATLNRVTGANLSAIDGKLNGTGSVFLVNRNGVVIGPRGTVVTGGSFVASTRDVANSQFMAGGTQEFSGTANASVVNNGNIVAKGGDVVLIGEAATNNGAIRAANGTAALAAGNEVVMSDVSGPAGVYVAPDAGTSGNVTNTGSIQAAAAALAAAGGNVYALAGNRAGLIQATGTRSVNGQVWLTAPNATVAVNATRIVASTATGAGGSIIANGKNVSIGATANLSAAATAAGQAGGRILVGASAPGGVHLAASTRIADGATISARGLGSGAGGSIETSGARLALGAANVTAGAGGSWLLDPTNLTIGTAAAGAISNALNSGSSVTEQTTAIGFSDDSGKASTASGPGDIIVAAPIDWTSAAKLTLSAYNDIDIDAAITAAGAGSLLLTTGNNTGGVSASGTGVNFGGGSIRFTSQGKGALSINGSAYGLIWTLGQFSAMNGGGHYALAENINAGGQNFALSPFTGIFSGIFNGLGNGISNLTIAGSASVVANVGLFANIGATGVVRNIALSGVNITGNYRLSRVGALAGDNNGTIADSFASGRVAGGAVEIGGLVGRNNGRIENSFASGTVTGSGNLARLGGLAGANYGTIADSAAAAAVLGTGNATAGGYPSIGGLAGFDTGLIENSYATGAVTGTGTGAYAGGLVGDLTTIATTGTIKTSYASGAVTATGANSHAGGLVAENGGVIADSYWDTQTTGQNNAVAGATGLATDALASALPGGFSGSVWGDANGQSTPYLLKLSAVNQAVYFASNSTFLKDNPTFTTADQVYAVQSAAGLQAIDSNLAGDYALLADIDAAGFGFSPIGETSAFTGVFDGLGNGISSLTINDPAAKYAGLFGQIGAGGVVRNVTLANANITGNAANKGIGALAGMNNGTVIDSSASGTVNGAGATGSIGGLLGANAGQVSGSDASVTVSGASAGISVSAVGGLVGLNAIGGTIVDSAASGAVGGGKNAYIGGLAGINRGTLADDYATGAVTSTATFVKVGGLVGWALGGAIENSFATGAVTDTGADSSVGGLAGELYGGLLNGVYVGTVADSFATGAVTAGTASHAGGFVGNIHLGKIADSFSTGAVLAGAGSSAGGFAGYNDDGTITDSYWDITTSGRSNGVGGGDSSGVTGLTTDALAAALPAGFSAGVWGDLGGQSTPYLLADPSVDQPVYLSGALALGTANASPSASLAYVVQDVQGLQAINDNLAADYVLAGDIDAANFNFSPIGETSAFTGSFDGLGHTISNLTIDESSDRYVGLFGQIGASGVVENTDIADASVTASNDDDLYVGALAGRNSGTVANDRVTGQVTGSITHYGGVQAIGGLVGFNAAGGTIEGSQAGDLVDGSGVKVSVGGLAGANWGSIKASDANGAVTGSGIGSSATAWIGGLAGSNLGSISLVYAAGEVTGDGTGAKVGGLIGYNFGTIDDGYATGAVSGNAFSSVGGFAGFNQGGARISNSFSTGAVTGGKYAGGFAGGNNGTIKDSYWDITTSGQSKGVGTGSSSGLTGLTTAVLAAALPAGFSAGVWGDLGGQSTPYLLADASVDQPVYLSGALALGMANAAASASLAYVVQDVQGLQAINDDLAADYVLAGDIDAANFSFSPIGLGVSGFTGILDGLGHSISNLNINKSFQDVGLFGVIGAGGLVENLGLDDAEITGNLGSADIGALAGLNRGTIENSYANGTVTGTAEFDDVGGLVGANGGTIADSYVLAAVTATQAFSDVGGLVGKNTGKITQCLTLGPVSGTGAITAAGGFAGRNSGTITDSFWDITTSGQSKGVGVGSSSGLRSLPTTTLAKSLPSGFSASVWGDDGGQTTPYLLADAAADQPVYFAAGSAFLKDNPSLNDTSEVYLVQNVQGLQAINNDLAADYALATDVDAANFAFSPIGETSAFTGIFDGLGHTISNLTIDETSDRYVGLFGQIGASGVVENTDIADASVTASNDDDLYVGALAGRNSGTVANDRVTGQVTGSITHYGGVQAIGGLVGFNAAGGTIEGSQAGDLVDGSGVKVSVGGLAGANWGSIKASDATGAVTGSGIGSGATAWIGGLAGSNLGSISLVYAAGEVAGDGTGGKVGGLIGYNFGTIDDGYATGAVSGDAFSSVGGFAGFNQGGARISNSYSTGAVTGGKYAGGFAGGNNGTIKDSYWDITTSGQSKGVGTGSSSGLTGLTTAVLAAALPAGFSAGVWGDLGAQSTPYLLADASVDQPVYLGGALALGMADASASASLAYVVQDVQGLQAINDDLAADYVLAGDIDAANFNFSPIGETSAFTGIFDGLGQTISDLTINDASGDYKNAGLFGQIGVGGTVENLALANVKITGAASSLGNTGALAGSNDGTILNSYASGKVTAAGNSARIGGLVGENYGKVDDSAANVAVTDSGRALIMGGLAGYNLGLIKDSYANGAVNKVTGGTFNDYVWVGGLAGANEGRIIDSYATGKITIDGHSRHLFGFGGLVGYNRSGTITDSYWDTTSSGQSQSVGKGSDTGATGLTTAQLTAALPTGFSPSIWGDDNGQSLPYLLALYFVN